MIPHPDPAGLAIAVVSAFLFTFAILYVIRSRRAAREIEAPLTSVLSGADWHQMEREFFSTVLLESGRPGLGLIASAGLHLLVLGGTPLTPYLFHEKLTFDLSKYNVRVVEFRVPEPLLYTAGASAEGQLPAPKPRLVKSGARAAKPAVPARGQEAPPTEIRARLKFELPAAPQKLRSRDVVLQPDQPPEMPVPLSQSLPRTLLWALGPAPLDKSQLVGAAKDRSLPVFSMPQTAPRIQRPNRELAVLDLQIAPSPELMFRSPLLPVSPANIAPLSAAGEAHGELPPTPLPPGNPINLIALLEKIALPSPAYLAELGNRLAESAGAGGSSAAEARGTTPAAAAPVDAPAVGGAESPRGTHADLLAAVPNPAAEAASENRGETASRPRPAPSGTLGVIIVQQSSLESGLEGAEVLSGQPVYTVYLDVPGSPRRWILQYCVPDSTSRPSFVQESEGRIQILPRRSVQPPFPMERIPVDLRGFQGSNRRLVVYALVNEKGETENVRLVRGTGQPIDTTAVATLRRWSFRPATRGDSPVAVEALFGIPLQ